MSWSVALVLDSIVAVVFVSLAIVGFRNRDRPGAMPAALLWATLAVLASVLALGRADLLGSRTVVTAVVVGWIVAVPLWATFVFEHTGRGPSMSGGWVGLVVIVVTALIGTSLWGGALDGALGQLLRVGTSILQTAFIGVGLFGVFLLVRSTVTYDDLSRGHAATLSIGGVVISLLLFSVSTLNAVNPVTLPWTVTGFLGLIAAAFSIGVVQYRPFAETPGAGPLARSSVLEEMSDAVIVVDREDHLVDANAAAEDALGVSVASDAGRPVTAVLGWDPATVVDEPSWVPTPTGQRQLDGTSSVLRNQKGESVGRSYVLRDVTDRRTREQRLEVLNRVLRHNFRNDLDAIRGFAEGLSEGTSDNPDAVAERIRATASGLIDVGETVERAERVMTQDVVEAEQVHLPDVLEDVASTVRDQYECRISMSNGTDQPLLRTDGAMLRTALLEVVENAVEHSETEEPQVTIDVMRTEGGIRLVVRDDGPGIPESEQAVLLEGEETPLQHGTGVGLWFVSWAITRLGGTLSFEDTEDVGSAVVLEIPDRAHDSADTTDRTLPID